MKLKIKMPNVELLRGKPYIIELVTKSIELENLYEILKQCKPNNHKEILTRIKNEAHAQIHSNLDYIIHHLKLEIDKASRLI